MSVPTSFGFHARLNSPEVVSGGWYRRNVAQYELLSYVNHVIALQLAGDWETAALFVRRAAKYLASPDAERLTPEYRTLVHAFLNAVLQDLSCEDLGELSPKFVDEARRLLASITGA